MLVQHKIIISIIDVKIVGFLLYVLT